MSNKQVVNVVSSDRQTRNFLIEIPSNCIHCNVIAHPNLILTTVYNCSIKEPIAVLFQCPVCKSYFVCAYEPLSIDSFSGCYETKLIPYSYSAKEEYDLPEELESISDEFKKIYMESKVAEAYQLNKIAGVGYRKAIEFLIKDYLINVEKEPSDKISKIPLMQAINKLEDKKIRNLATAATWLGNDETHYVKKYTDKDITDMKKFLKALAHFISYNLLAYDAEELIEGN